MPQPFDNPLATANDLFVSGRLAEAAALYEQITRVEPSCVDALYCLGLVRYEQGKYTQAAELHRRALTFRPSFPEAECGLALCLRALGDDELALRHYRNVRARLPCHADAIAGEAAILERLGNYTQSWSLLSQALDSAGDNTNILLTYAALAPHLDRSQDAIARIERLLSLPSWPHSHRLQLHFAAGKLCDEQSEFERAFRHFASGNALNVAAFNPAAHQQLIDQLITTYSAENLARFPHASNRSEIPVFIVGMPRSGTTLTETILATHDRVSGAGELALFNHISAGIPAERLRGRSLSDVLADLDQPTLDNIAGRYLDELERHRTGPQVARITDKMPYNYLHLGLIQMLFPKARIIHCIRDARDTCLSCYFQNFIGQHPYAYNLEHLGSYYRGYERLMAHWRRHISLPLFELRYEDLVAAPEDTIARLLDFCGLEWSDVCLRFHESRRTVRTASYQQIRRPLYSASVGRWRHYEKHLSGLLRELGPQHTEQSTGTHP